MLPHTSRTVETVNAASPMPGGLRAGTRRYERRRRHLVRMDIGFGLFAAAAALLLAPGVAIVGIVALLIIMACIGSLGVERRRSRRRVGR